MEDLTGKTSSKLLRGSILGKPVQIGLPLSKCHNSTILFLWLIKFDEHFFPNNLQVFSVLVSAMDMIYGLDQFVLTYNLKKNHSFLVRYLWSV